MNRPIHIVCLDAPSPPDYGGAIDIYYKVKALAEAGWTVNLHYFNYKKERSAEGLESFCHSIHAYERGSFFSNLPLGTPFIISSRVNRLLAERLNGDRDPILLEGLHCAGLIPLLNEPGRVVIRMHNNEADYYKRLSKTEQNFFSKIYLQWEGSLLHRYMNRLDPETKLACLSLSDLSSFRDDYHFNQTHFIPCFIPWQVINGEEGLGKYCLYHGNLSVSENEAAASWLIENVFHGSGIRLVVAGKGISAKLSRLASAHPQVELIADPSMEQINMLVRGAQVNVLPSLNTTGVKLKLLHALMEGRFCLSNQNGVTGSGAENFVTIAESPEEMIGKAKELMDRPFSEAEKKNRQALLAVYDNLKNAQKLSALW